MFRGLAVITIMTGALCGCGDAASEGSVAVREQSMGVCSQKWFPPEQVLTNRAKRNICECVISALERELPPLEREAILSNLAGDEARARTLLLEIEKLDGAKRLKEFVSRMPQFQQTNLPKCIAAGRS